MVRGGTEILIFMDVPVDFLLTNGSQGITLLRRAIRKGGRHYRRRGCVM